MKQISDEVFYADDLIVKISRGEIQFLKERCNLTKRKRVRLCAHKNLDSDIHEMIIVLSNQTYIRPHKHINKTESFHIIEGLIDVVIFDETGNIVEVVHMGDLLSGHNFFYRLSDDYYHTPIIRSDFAVFHETINGPFDRTDTIEAPWAPDEADFFGQKKYSERMLRDLDRLR